mgnify:CR=1 FL=1
MDLSTLLIILAIGAVSGWLAGFIRQGYGFGLLGNIVIGFIGSWVFGELGLSLGAGLIGTVARSVIGALILLFLIGLVRKAK